MFEQAITEIRSTRDAADALRGARGERDFLVRFNAFVASAQSVLIAMLKEGRGERLPGFAAWYATKRAQLEEDEVFLMVCDARDFDFDDGPHRLRFVSGPTQLIVDEQGRPVDATAWCALPAAPTIHVAIDNAPEVHDGRQLERRDPLALSETVLVCLDSILVEAGDAVEAAA